MIKFIIIDKNKQFKPEFITDFVEALQNDPKIQECCIYESTTSSWNLKIKFNNGALYFMELSSATYDTNAQLFIKLYPQIKQQTFDHELEGLKITAKNLWLNEIWADTECLWLEDEQVLELAQDLYCEINRVENALRIFINQVMVHTFGVTWWQDLAPKKLKKKYSDRMPIFRRDVPSFRNVSDYLLSIDVDDLIEIMSITIKKWEPNVTDAIEQAVSDGDGLKLLELIKAQYIVKRDLWDSLFKNYFDDNFKTDWKEFYNNRNLIAHNKLLDFPAFTTIKQNIKKVETSIEQAKRKFDQNLLSQEDIDIIQQEFNEYLEQKDKIARIESEAHVRILDHEEIFDKLNEELTSLVSNLTESLYFRKDLEIEEKPLSVKDPNGTVLSITSKINSSEIKLSVTSLINDEQGGTSTFHLLLKCDEENAGEYELQYINGEAHLNKEQGLYVPYTQNELITEGLELFVNEIEQAIGECFPNLVEKIDALRYASRKDEDDDPVADFPCEECGEYTISLNEALCEIGKCVSCGHQHDLEECLRCGAMHNGSGGFCESCKVYIQEQD